MTLNEYQPAENPNYVAVPMSGRSSQRARERKSMMAEHSNYASHKQLKYRTSKE